MTVVLIAIGHGRSSPEDRHWRPQRVDQYHQPVAADTPCMIGVSTPMAPRAPPTSMAGAASATRMVGGVPVSRIAPRSPGGRHRGQARPPDRAASVGAEGTGAQPRRHRRTGAVGRAGSSGAFADLFREGADVRRSVPARSDPLSLRRPAVGPGSGAGRRDASDHGVPRRGGGLRGDRRLDGLRGRHHPGNGRGGRSVERAATLGERGTVREDTARRTVRLPSRRFSLYLAGWHHPLRDR